MEKVSSNLVSACSVSPHPVHWQSRPEHRAEVPLVVREILEITGGVLVEDKCPRGLTEESVDRIRKGIGTGDRSASLQHMKWRGCLSICLGGSLAQGGGKPPLLPLLLPCHFSCVYRNCERKLHWKTIFFPSPLPFWWNPRRTVSAIPFHS